MIRHDTIRFGIRALGMTSSLITFSKFIITALVFHRSFTFAIIMSSSVRLSVVGRLSVTFVRPTQAIEIFGSVSTLFGTLVIC